MVKHEETRRVPDNPNFLYLAMLKQHVAAYGDTQEPVAQPRTDQDLYSDRIRTTDLSGIYDHNWLNIISFLTSSVDI